MSLREAFTEAYDMCMFEKGRCHASDIARTAQERYPELFREESQHLIWQATLHAAKGFMRQSGVQEAPLDLTDQPYLPFRLLPGLPPPQALAVPQPDGEYEYVRYDCATWADLKGALIERTTNLRRARKRQRDHQRKMAIFEPYLEPYPLRTVGEAMAIMKKETEGQ